MSWLKQSDVSANHPLVLRVLEMDEADDRLLNEMYGWVNRCATQSAAFDRDYIVEVGTAKQMAGLSRYKELLKAALSCGIFEEKEIEENGSMRRVLKLVEEEDLFHMILKSDKEREKNRRADTYDLAKKGAIIKRDGAECRWCGRMVTFGNDRKSIKAGTIDHLDPKDLDNSDPTPIDRLVVACTSCNSSRKDGGFWDKELRPAPRTPYFTADAAAWLRDKAGILVKVSTERVELHAPKPAPASNPVNGPALHRGNGKRRSNGQHRLVHHHRQRSDGSRQGRALRGNGNPGPERTPVHLGHGHRAPRHRILGNDRST